jgi:hypothetical protein
MAYTMDLIDMPPIPKVIFYNTENIMLVIFVLDKPTYLKIMSPNHWRVEYQKSPALSGAIGTLCFFEP